jgi:hypothetical protein
MYRVSLHTHTHSFFSFWTALFYGPFFELSILSVRFLSFPFLTVRFLSFPFLTVHLSNFPFGTSIQELSFWNVRFGLSIFRPSSVLNFIFLTVRCELFSWNVHFNFDPFHRRRCIRTNASPPTVLQAMAPCALSSPTRYPSPPLPIFIDPPPKKSQKKTPSILLTAFLHQFISHAISPSIIIGKHLSFPLPCIPGPQDCWRHVAVHHWSHERYVLLPVDQASRCQRRGFCTRRSRHAAANDAVDDYGGTYQAQRLMGLFRPCWHMEAWAWAPALHVISNLEIRETACLLQIYYMINIIWYRFFCAPCVEVVLYVVGAVCDVWYCFRGIIHRSTICTGRLWIRIPVRLLRCFGFGRWQAPPPPHRRISIYSP